MPRLRVRPSPVMSGVAAVLAAGFTVFGVVMLIETGHPFLILWTFLALLATLYHGHNCLTGGRGVASEVIDYDDPPPPPPPPPAPPPPAAPRVAQADKLRELKRLADDGVITAAEYEHKKEEILRSAW